MAAFYLGKVADSEPRVAVNPSRRKAEKAPAAAL